MAKSRPEWHFRNGASCAPPDTSPKNLPTAWVADGHDTQHGQTGPCSPPAYSPWGAARLQLQEEPVSNHGSTVFKELSDRLGAFGCRGGKRRATYAEQSRKHKTGLSYSQAELHRTFPSLGSCLGPGFQNSLLRDLDFSKTCTGLSLCWAGGTGRSSHDRQAEG